MDTITWLPWDPIQRRYAYLVSKDTPRFQYRSIEFYWMNVYSTWVSSSVVSFISSFHSMFVFSVYLTERRRWNTPSNTVGKHLRRLKKSFLKIVLVFYIEGKELEIWKVNSSINFLYFEPACNLLTVSSMDLLSWWLFYFD